jgi:signal peptidase I
MEDITYLFRQPHRGDVVVFKTHGIEKLPDNTRYVKRVVGTPGEHVLLAGGQLFINNQLTVISNDFGGITYLMPIYPKMYVPVQPDLQTNLTVPDACYFVVGDSATNSFDSRSFGSVPRQNITGRICFCYWPPQRIGLVK